MTGQPPIPPVRVEFLLTWLRENRSALSEEDLRARLVAAGHDPVDVGRALERLRAESAAFPAGQPMSQQPAAGGGGTGAGFNQESSRQLADFRQGFKFSDFVTFRYMITPPLITVLWVLSVILITIAALASLNSNALVAVAIWIIGMVWVRVVFEVMIVLFKINDGIQTMARRR
jgi:hypothetical protein